MIYTFCTKPESNSILLINTLIQLRIECRSAKAHFYVIWIYRELDIYITYDIDKMNEIDRNLALFVSN